MATNLNNTVPAQAAGHIIQLERALNHLAHAKSDASVAVEYIDDVVVIESGNITIQEQDKSSSKRNSNLLADRSQALWRTLEIWMSHRVSDCGHSCERFLFFVNHPVSTPIAMLLKSRMNGEMPASAVVVALRKVGAGTRPTKIQVTINNVLRHNDSDLTALIERIEIIEDRGETLNRREVSNGLGLHPRANTDDILDGLLGWVTRRLRQAWSEGKPGIITRRELLLQSHALQNQQARSRFLPRASSEVTVTPAARTSALSRPFVEHLGRIEADGEDIVQAVDHFLKFNIEKHRLVGEGEIPDAEWLNRGARLQERWRQIMRRRRRELKGALSAELGQTILADVTYEHREELDGHSCAELYMTAGHYHRLADEDEVWWDPNYEK